MRMAMMAGVMVAMTSGCSDNSAADSARNQVQSLLECSMASKLVGQVPSIDPIADEVNRVVAKAGIEVRHAEVKEMHDRIKARWDLKSKSRHDQDVLLVGVYNSDLCVAAHGHRKITVEEVSID
ncbi:hypothetical protein [Pseudomonas saponiphila]|nr:hypothetical protein [Pseudomonas saponiphila]